MVLRNVPDVQYAVGTQDVGNTKVEPVVSSIRSRTGMRVMRCLERDANPSRPRVYEVTIIEEGWGNAEDQNYYTADLLKNSYQIFNGVRAFADHPSKTEAIDQPERSVKDLVGWYRDPDYSIDPDNGRGRVTARLYVLPTASWLIEKIDAILADDTTAPQDLIGLSVNAIGAYEPAVIDGHQGYKVLDFRLIDSVDIVTRAGARGKFNRILESDRKRIVEAASKLFSENMIVPLAVEKLRSGAAHGLNRSEVVKLLRESNLIRRRVGMSKNGRVLKESMDLDLKTMADSLAKGVTGDSPDDLKMVASDVSRNLYQLSGEQKARGTEGISMKGSKEAKKEFEEKEVTKPSPHDIDKKEEEMGEKSLSPEKEAFPIPEGGEDEEEEEDYLNVSPDLSKKEEEEEEEDFFEEADDGLYEDPADYELAGATDEVKDDDVSKKYDEKPLEKGKKAGNIASLEEARKKFEETRKSFREAKKLYEKLKDLFEAGAGTNVPGAALASDPDRHKGLAIKESNRKLAVLHGGLRKLYESQQKLFRRQQALEEENTGLRRKNQQLRSVIELVKSARVADRVLRESGIPKKMGNFIKPQLLGLSEDRMSKVIKNHVRLAEGIVEHAGLKRIIEGNASKGYSSYRDNEPEGDENFAAYLGGVGVPIKNRKS